MKKIPSFLKNKYALTALLFVIWLSFFDRNNFISQYSDRQELKKIQSDKAFYLKEITQNKEDMDDLMSDKEHLEKYGRERYMMKKDDEDIFLIISDSTEENTEYSEK